MSDPVPIYFSHSYRPEDRELNRRFWQIFNEEKFAFTVDPQSTPLSPTSLELMMARSAGFAAVATYRREEPNYQCSPFIVHEYSLAVLTNKPRIVLRDQRVSPRYFDKGDTIDIAFSRDAPERTDAELRRQLRRLYRRAVNAPARPHRRGRVGLLLGTGDRAKEAPEWRGGAAIAERRQILENTLETGGDSAVDLLRATAEHLELGLAASECDFVIADLDDSGIWGVTEFLQGRGVPVLRLLHRGKDPQPPRRLLGSEALHRVAEEELAVRWADLEEFRRLVDSQIARTQLPRTEFRDYEQGHRYFGSIGRPPLPVFISNADSANEFARDLATALNLENIPYFHYRWNPTIELGTPWAPKLAQKIASSAVFVPLIDEAYWNSQHCRREYDAATEVSSEDGALTIIPYFIRPQVHGPDVPQQGFDVSAMSTAEAVRHIVGQLDGVLRRRAHQQTDPPAIARGNEAVEVGAVPADIAILTILDEEYDAVYRLLDGVQPVAGSAVGPNQHAWVVGKVQSTLYGATFSVVLGRISPVGTSAAAVAAMNTVTAFQPRSLLVVGVAGGLAGVGLGDVVVADEICAYEYGKLEDGSFRPRSKLDVRTDSSLVTAPSALLRQWPTWFTDLQPGSPQLRVISVR